MPLAMGSFLELAVWGCSAAMDVSLRCFSSVRASVDGVMGRIVPVQKTLVSSLPNLDTLRECFLTVEMAPIGGLRKS